MSRCKALGLGSVAALVAMFLTASSVQAEPYGGFNSHNTRTTYIDYGPRYVQQVQTVTTVAQPVRQTTTVVQTSPVVEYVQPVGYPTVYPAPAYGVGFGGYGGYGGYGAFGYAGIPVAYGGAYYGGSRHGYRSYGRSYGHRNRGYIGGGHYRSSRGFVGYRGGRHGRSSGFSIGGGFSRGRHGGGGSFSFRSRH